MSQMNEETTNKLVGKLISVLHAKSSDARDLALVQLVMMGDLAIQPLLAYLQREEDFQNDLEALGKAPTPLRGGPREHEAYREASERFREKWDQYPTEYAAEDSAIGRSLAIQGAFEALSLIGRKDSEKSFPRIAKVVGIP